jgi:hypothetical protein
MYLPDPAAVRPGPDLRDGMPAPDREESARRGGW